MKLKVLMVDDDVEFTQLIKFNLERKDCELRIAHDGAEGLRLARAEAPDLILLDLMLPDIAGMSLCEILQSRPSTQDVPIFIVSALDQSWFEKSSKRAKFSRFFTKPVDLKLLSESVSSVCKKTPTSAFRPPLKRRPKEETPPRGIRSDSNADAEHPL